MREHDNKHDKHSGARRHARLVWLMAAVLATLQACGGSDGDNGAATPPPPPSSGGPTPTPSPSPAPGPSPAPSPTPAPSPAPAAAYTCGFANFDAEMLQRVNAKRAAGASCGTKGTFAPTAPLAWNAKLTNAAYGHSRDMADQNYFAHNSLDGRTMAQRITAAGYGWSAIGENIAAGYGSVQAVVDGWMASDGHCANIMSATYKDIGVACARNPSSTYGTYWTMDLGKP